MEYVLEQSASIRKEFRKLAKKSPNELEAIWRKIEEILKNPSRFKPLRNSMKGIFRVHIVKSFVLTFEVRESEKVVLLLEYEHHDKIYKH